MSDELRVEEFSFKRLFLPLTTLKATHIIVIVGLIVFSNMLFNGFVMDDLSYIQNNPEVHSFNIEKIFGQSFFNSESSFYRPITVLYFTLIYLSFHDAVFFYHIFQLTLHIIDVILVFYLFKHFFSKKISLFLSLIFLFHPAQVESVTYITASNSPIFFFFGITALLLCLKSNLTFKRWFGISGLLLLSLLTKETGLLFLIIIFFYLLFVKKKYLVKFSLTAATACLIYLFMRVVVGGILIAKPSGGTINQLNLSQRLINIPAIIFYYINILFLPIRLVIDQQWVIKTIDYYHFYLPLVIEIGLLLLITVYLYRLKKDSQRSIFLFFSLWFLGGLFINLPFFSNDVTVADRLLYCPIAGFLGMLGVVLQSIKLPGHKIRVAGYIAGSIVLILLAWRTVIRNMDWHDPFTLYTHDSNIETNYDIENNLGFEYESRQNYDKAIRHFNKSVALYPYQVTLSNLAHAYQGAGNYQKAKEYYIKTLHSKYIDPLLHDRVSKDAYKELAELSRLYPK